MTDAENDTSRLKDREEAPKTSFVKSPSMDEASVLIPARSVECAETIQDRSSSTKRSSPTGEVLDSNKKIRSAADSPENGVTSGEEILDLAVSLGYQDGDRIEVSWEVSGGDDGDEDEVVTRWWGATLLPFDGRTQNGMAIRTLEYDSYPEGGFPDKSREDVLFLETNVLADPVTQEMLQFRRAGAEEIFSVDSVESVVDQILQGVMAKNQAAWNKMTAAQQAQIASKIAAKKEKLIELLEQQTDVVTLQGMQSILAQAMDE